MQSNSERVLVRIEQHVAVITVNDPDRRNAVTDEMSAALRAVVQRTEADPDVHALVITGAGTAFCAGADLSALGSAAEDGLHRLYDGFLAVADCALPTIAAVNGPAVGAGLNLALRPATFASPGRGHCSNARFQKPGTVDSDHHAIAVRAEVGPQAKSIQSPEFAERLAAARATKPQRHLDRRSP